MKPRHNLSAIYYDNDQCHIKDCWCKKRKICKKCGKKNCKCNIELVNIDASEDINVTTGDTEIDIERGDIDLTTGDTDVDIEQGDVDVNQGQGQTLGSQTQNPVENQQQTMGAQTQNSSQGQSGSTLGDLNQNPSQGQSGSTLGDLTQNPSQGQSGSTLSQTQNPTQSGSTVTQNSSPTFGDQTTGAQTQQANPTNNSTADISVDGVTVNVPVTLTVNCDCDEKKKGKKRDQKKDFCDCCAKSLGELLNQVRQIQLSSLANNTIDFFLINSPALDNELPNQIITNVNDCSTVTVAEGPLPIVPPLTTLQLCKVAGIQAPSTSPTIVDFLVNFGSTCSTTINNDCDCDDKDCKECKCGKCAEGIGELLPIGSQVDLIIESAEDVIENVFVLNVCDCLAIFVDSLVTPTTAYVFTLCSINGFAPTV